MNSQVNNDDKLLDGILAGRILVDPRTAAGSEVTRRVVRQLVRRGGRSQPVEQQEEQEEVQMEQVEEPTPQVGEPILQEEPASQRELDCTHVWYEAQYYIACNKCRTYMVASASGRGVKSHVIVQVDGVFYWVMCGRTINRGDAVFFAEPDICGMCERLLQAKGAKGA